MNLQKHPPCWGSLVSQGVIAKAKPMTNYVNHLLRIGDENVRLCCHGMLVSRNILKNFMSA